LNSIKKYIKSIVDISDDKLDKFLSLGKEESLSNGNYYIEFDQVCDKVSFIKKGFVRFFHVNKGEEITRDFLFENNFITSFKSYITGQPSEVYIQALDDCELSTFKKSDIIEYYDKNPKIERLGRIIAEHQFIAIENYFLSFLNEDAETRYKKLLERSPELVQKIPLKYIASFLGITPQHLSRIRKII
jgi:CRP-like cAMP-binding protein